KARTLLLQALLKDHMPDFHHYDDARDIWMAVKARFEEEGLHKGYDRIGHNYGVKAAAAPIYSAFVGASSSGSKPGYSNHQNQDMIYEDFDQVDQMEMEELNLKWQLAMLSLRINRDHATKGAASVSDATAEFAMMGISPQ
nr:hypothetical protein [Tanacetum cinerariifolium]